MIEKAVVHLETLLEEMDIPNNIKCILGPNSKIRLTFCVDAVSNHYFYYIIVLKTALIIKNPNGGAISLCDAACFADSYHGHNGGTQYQPGNPGGNQPFYHYNNIETAYANIYVYLNTLVPFGLPAAGYLNCCDWFDGLTWQPLSGLVVWP